MTGGTSNVQSMAKSSFKSSSVSCVFLFRPFPVALRKIIKNTWILERTKVVDAGLTLTMHPQQVVASAVAVGQ